MDSEEALFYALQYDDAGSLKRILSDGGNVNTTFYGMYPITMSHWSALHLCCEKGSYQCAKVLLEGGYTIN